MKTLFDYTVGKKAEDTTSAVLAFLMAFKRDTDSGKAICDFFHLPNTNFFINEQKTQGAGRFDLYIKTLGDDSITVIENKLEAGFTWNVDGKHQLERYSKWLKECTEREKRLVVLCPKKREHEVKKEIEIHVDKKAHLTEILIWEDLTKKLEQYNTDVIACELCKFINTRYIANLRLSKGEVEMIKNIEFGRAYSKLLNILSQVREQLPKEYKPSKAKFDNNDNTYGFYFVKDHTEYWMGLWTDIWEDYGKPVVLQNRTLRNENSAFKQYLNKDNNPYYGFIYEIKDISDTNGIIDEITKII